MSGKNTKIILENEKYWKQQKKILTEKQTSEFSRTNGSNKITPKVFEILLENQRKQLLTEQITTQDINPIVRTVLGLFKKFFPKLIQNEIVSVQPMNGPISVVKVKRVKVQGQEVPDFSLSTPDGLPENDMSKPQQKVLENQEVAQGSEQDITITLQEGERLVQGSIVVSDGSETVTDMNGFLYGQNFVGTVNYETGVIHIRNLDGTNALTLTIRYLTNQQELNRDLTRVSFSVENLPIYQNTRKLKQTWTYEQVEDQNQELGGLINFEDEIYEDISSLIQQEINREILNDLITQQTSQGHTQDWQYQNPTSLNLQTQEQYFRTLLYTINGVQQTIMRKVKVFRPNFIVVSPFMWSVIQDGLSQYSWETKGDNLYTVGFQKVGNLSNTYSVYVTPSIPDNKVLVGYKGSSIQDSGYVYQPYVPLKQVPVTYETTPGLMFYTRYGKLTYQPWFYGVVNINGL